MKVLLIRTIALVAVAAMLMSVWLYRPGVIRSTHYSLDRDGATWHKARVTCDLSWQSDIEDWVGERLRRMGVSGTMADTGETVPQEQVPYLTLAEVIHARSTFAASLTDIDVYDQPSDQTSLYQAVGIHPRDARLCTGVVMLMKSRHDPLLPGGGAMARIQIAECLLFIDDASQVYLAGIKDFAARGQEVDPLTLRPARTDESAPPAPPSPLAPAGE